MPSPELQKRIFTPPPVPMGPRVSPPIRAFRLSDLSQWLVPAFGCFLLVIATLSSRYPAHPTGAYLATNMLFSDNSPAYGEAVISARADHSDKNSLPAPRLEWSFGSSQNSTAYDTTAQTSYTNKIIQ